MGGEGGEGGRGTFSNHHCLYIHVLAAVGVYEALPQLETHQCILVSQPVQEGQGERERERGRDRERRKRERDRETSVHCNTYNVTRCLTFSATVVAMRALM